MDEVDSEMSLLIKVLRQVTHLKMTNSKANVISNTTI